MHSVAAAEWLSQRGPGVTFVVQLGAPVTNPKSNELLPHPSQQHRSGNEHYQAYCAADCAACRSNAGIPRLWRHQGNGWRPKNG